MSSRAVRELLNSASGPVRCAPRDLSGVLAFKGIPYAAPPVGKLRWRAPHPAAAWSAVLDASTFGPYGISSTGPKGNESEDCLTINVWTAALTAEEKRPVMVWIPGGGFQVAQSSRVNIDGAPLAMNGVVVVSFNYRVNVFGFLAHPQLDAEGFPSGNFGLQDQIAALKWVQENIESFGGDPENVTIFGESAGATSVALLMASPEARGLFHKAIGESGGFCESIHGSMLTFDEARRKGESFVATVAGGSIAALRRLSADELRQAVAFRGLLDPLVHGFTPSIDGFVVPEEPAQIFLAGRQAQVPLIVGWNVAEGFGFSRMARSFADADAFGAAADALAGADRRSEFREHYPFSKEGGFENALVEFCGDTFVVEQASRWLRVHNRSSSASVFGYLFDVKTAYTPVSAHTAEIDYVFGTLEQHWLAPTGGPPSARDHDLAREMGLYWTNFARFGDPNGAGLPLWPRYGEIDPELMTFGNEQSAAKVEQGRAGMAFLASLRGTDGRRPQAWRSDVMAL